jgi:hypothetical protein
MLYTTCCIHSTGEAINAMKDKAREITYRTFRKHCPDLDTWAQGMGYFLHTAQGLTLKNDWHVAYFKSEYQGKPCYYLVHSAIEHIWT